MAVLKRPTAAPRKSRPSLSDRWITRIPVLVLFVEAVALGADGPLLAAGATVLQFVAALVVFGVQGTPSRFWRGMRWPLIALLLALGWLISGQWDWANAVVARHWLAPDLILAGGMALAANIAFFLVGAAQGWRGFTRQSLDALIVAGLGITAASLLIALPGDDKVWGYAKGILAGRFTGTMLNANGAASLFGVIALISVGRALAFLSRRQGQPTIPLAVMVWVSIFTSLGACILTGSRTGSVGALALGLALCMSDAPLSARLRRLGRGRWIVWSGLALAAGAAVLALGELTMQRLGHAATDGDNRVALWQIYQRIAVKAPLGYGPGSFDLAVQAALTSPRDAQLTWYVHAPHNVALSLLLIGGWPYLGLLLGTGAVVVWRVLRAGGLGTLPMSRAVIAVLILMLACGLDDIALDIPAITALFAYLAGVLFGRAQETLSAPLPTAAIPVRTRGSAGVPSTSNCAKA